MAQASWKEAMRPEGLDGGEFWLPAEFFDDLSIIEDNRAVPVEGELLSAGFALCPLSSSQPESTTETETDEDYIARLTRRMARTFLFEGNGVSASSAKVPPMETSPKSPLSEAGMWSVMNQGSPNGPSQVSSPPSTSPLQRESDWDLLYTAEGEAMRMRQMERQCYGHSIHSPLKKTSAPAKSSVSGFMHNPTLTHQQLQTEQFYQLKLQQLIKQQLSAAWNRQSKAATSGRSNRTIGLTPSARSSLQRQLPVTGMKAGLLDIPDARRPSAGTGVFIPKRVGSLNEYRKKPDCSSVLPARIFQTLNLNLEDLRFLPRSPGPYSLDYEPALTRGNLALARQKWRRQQYHHYHTPSQPPPPAVTSHEIRLPTEWTY